VAVRLSRGKHCTVCGVAADAASVTAAEQLLSKLSGASPYFTDQLQKPQVAQVIAATAHIFTAMPLPAATAAAVQSTAQCQAAAAAVTCRVVIVKCMMAVRMFIWC
jgi:hypothetical protein